MKKNLFLSLKLNLIFSLLVFFAAIFSSCDLIMNGDIREELSSDLTAQYSYFENISDSEGVRIVFDMKIGESRTGDEVFPGDISLFNRGKKGFKLLGWKYVKNPIDGSLAAPGNFSFDENDYVNGFTVSPQPVYLEADWYAPYVVRHYWQDLGAQEDGSYAYSEYDEERFYGKVGTFTAAEVKIKEGFSPLAFNQILINDEGTTELDIYYDRNSYTYSFDLAGGTCATEFAPDGTLTKRYGTPLIVQDPVYSGYKFSKWQPPLPTTFQPGYSGFVAKWWSGESNYTVRHNMQHILDDGYDTTEEIEQGPTDDYSETIPKEFPGFTALPIEQQIINGNETTIVNVYYNRNIVSYTFSLDGGSTTTVLTNGALTGRYGREFTIADPTRTGYTFAGWNQTVPESFGTVNTEFTALWNPITYTLTFDKNASDATGSMANQSFVFDRRENLSSSAFARDGYVFTGWATSPAGSAQYADGAPYSIGPSDTTLYAVWVRGSGTRYTVNHWKQNTNGTAGSHDSSNYSLTDTDNLTGVTGSNTTASAKVYTGFTCSGITQKAIAADGSTVIDVYYDRTAYTLTFSPNGGSVAVPSQIFYYQASDNIKTVTELALRRAGYNFGGWATSENGSLAYGDGALYTIGAANATLYAIWTPATETEYIVRHWKQNPSGARAVYDSTNYTIAETERKTGTTGASTAATLKTYTGFTSPGIAQGSISPEGNTVVDIYYDRNAHSVMFDANGGTIATPSQTFYYQAPQAIMKVAALDLEKTGYNFAGWATTNGGSRAYVDGATYTIDDSDHTLYALWTESTSTRYTVRHWKQNVNGTASSHNSSNYTISAADTQTLYGTTGSLTEASAKTFPGFTNATIDQDTIATNGGTVVDIYYERNNYTLTFNASGGTITTSTQSLVYEKPTALTSASTLGLSKTGYTFAGWTVNASGGTTVNYTDGASYSIGSANATLYAVWRAAGETRYTVHHWKQIAGKAAGVYNSTNYAEETADQENLSGTTGENTAASPKSYTGFTNVAFEQKAINANGSTAINIYYNRNAYTLTLDANGGTPAASTQTFYFEVSQKIKSAENLTLRKTGYSFSGWNTASDGSGTNYADQASYTIGSANATLYAKWTAATTTAYTVRHWQQKTTGTAGNYTATNYEVKNTENLTGTTGTNTAAEAKTYTGFTNVSFAQKKITADGSTVVDIYYDRNSYRLNFNKVETDASIGTTSQTLLYGVPTKIKSAESLALVRPGYTFDGWSLTSGGSRDYVDEYSYEIGTSNVTLYARWKPNTYTVVFNKNASDATGSMGSQTFTYDVEQRLSSNAFSRAGYSFNCWKTSGGIPYANNATVSNLTTTANGTVNLYADWTATGTITVTISPGTSGADLTLVSATGTNKVTFTVQNAVAGTSYTWYVEGVARPGETSSTFELNCSGYPTGTTAVTVMVMDGNSNSATAQVKVVK